MDLFLIPMLLYLFTDVSWWATQKFGRKVCLIPLSVFAGKINVFLFIILKNVGFSFAK